MPWVHFHVTQQGSVTPCCQAPWQEKEAFGNINNQTIEEIWNNSAIRSFRKTLYTGEKDKRCESCYFREEAGFTSLRQITNARYEHKRQDILESASTGFKVTKPPVYFDIRFSNVCNLRCRICGPWSSSGWYNDGVELGMVSVESPAITRAFTNTKRFFAEFEKIIDFVEELYFAGGEPLVIEEHYQLLELLISRNKTNVKLTYNTNFSSFKYKHYNVVELWKKFPNISLAASLDASGQRGELLRKNLKWEDAVYNRKVLLQELPQLEFLVSPTINVYNLLHLPDFHKEWVEQKLINVEDFIPTLLVKPKELNVTGLPDLFKLKAKQKYTLHLSWINSMPSVNQLKREHMIKQFENILNALSAANTPGAVDAFFKNSSALDKLRNEKTLEVFPELSDLLGIHE